MIGRIVAFALRQRFITLAMACLLTVTGVVSYYRLPIEAYPDVGDVQVDIITIWSGHAAEEVERLITVPLEKELNGVANVTFLRARLRTSACPIFGSSLGTAPISIGHGSRSSSGLGRRRFLRTRSPGLPPCRA